MRRIFTFLLVLISIYASAQVKIYEIYGAGGNSSGVYSSDYVVLINTGNAAVDLTGWSLQYASATGTTWAKIDLSGNIPGNFGYYLIELTTSGTTGIALPTPDITSNAFGVDGISAANGKLVLMNTTTTIPNGTSDPQTVAGYVDFTGYGTANASEGGNAATNPTTARAIRRNAVDTDNNNNDFVRVVPNPRNSGSPLPVTLTSFKASTLGQEVILDWESSNESNFSHFSVERSNDARSFEAIGRVEALANSISEKTAYQFVDQTPNFGINYYRLKQVDIDGSSEYSRIITANMTEASPIVIYPNPSADFIRIKNGEKEAIKSYEIYDNAGKLICKSDNPTNEITVRDLQSGIYFLQLTNDRNLLINRRFVKK